MQVALHNALHTDFGLTQYATRFTQLLTISAYDYGIKRRNKACLTTINWMEVAHKRINSCLLRHMPPVIRYMCSRKCKDGDTGVRDMFIRAYLQ
jgi:hypothetical protein